MTKVALVTGGASGIGAAIAKALAKKNFYVIIADFNVEAGKNMVAALGTQARFESLDVGNEKNWIDVFSKISTLEVLVNNAGISGYDKDRGPQNPEEASLESWRAVQAINLDGVFLGCKYGIRAMKQYGGSIVNIASRSGLIGTPEAAAYAASKAAVINFTKSVALYCASKNYAIRCNSILPGAILTPIWKPLLGDDPEQEKARLKEFSKTIPLHTFGEPEDIAHAIMFLISDHARYITGTEINVDGGLGAGPLE